MDANENTPRGLFIVLEGPDGGGKTTQAASLASWLQVRGRTAIVCRDPGQTELGERIREVLLESKATIDPLAEMMLFSASRSQLVSEVILPALAAGVDVVCDRYLLSTIAYQGYGAGIGKDRIMAAFGAGGCDLAMPDVTIVLDVPPAVSAARRAGRKADNIEKRDAAYHARVRRGFLEYRWDALKAVVVDAALPLADVGAQIRSHVLPLLPK